MSQATDNVIWNFLLIVLAGSSPGQVVDY